MNVQKIIARIRAGGTLAHYFRVQRKLQSGAFSTYFEAPQIQVVTENWSTTKADSNVLTHILNGNQHFLERPRKRFENLNETSDVVSRNLNETSDVVSSPKIQSPNRENLDLMKYMKC